MAFVRVSVVTVVISMVRDVVRGIEIVTICLILILCRKFALGITLFGHGFCLGLLVGLELSVQIRNFCPDRKCSSGVESSPFAELMVAAVECPRYAMIHLLMMFELPLTILFGGSTTVNVGAGLLCHLSLRDDILAEEANKQDVHIYLLI